MSSTESPVKVGFADDVHIFIVSAMKKLFFGHIAPTVVVLHVSFLPLFSKKKSEGLNQADTFRE